MKSVTTQSIDSCMNLLMSKIDKVDNNSEMENLVFELQSLKSKRNKTRLNTFGSRKTSVPDTKITGSPFKPMVPQKLQNKIRNFVKKIDEGSQFDVKTVYTDTQAYQSPFSESVKKRPVDQNLAPLVKFIHQDVDLYEEYQVLMIDFENNRSQINLKSIRLFLSIVNPSKLEHNIGIVLLYILAHLDNTVLVSNSNF